MHLALTETVHLTLLLGEIASMLPAIDQPVDAWYLDGFTPAKNPDMWDERLFEHMQHHTQPGGTCATYTAASFVRRGLQQAGFDVQKVPGYGRKREMITGTFRGAAAAGACP